MHTGIRINVTS